jgi:hypothetical protein
MGRKARLQQRNVISPEQRGDGARLCGYRQIRWKWWCGRCRGSGGVICDGRVQKIGRGGSHPQTPPGHATPTRLRHFYNSLAHVYKEYYIFIIHLREHGKRCVCGLWRATRIGSGISRARRRSGRRSG